HRRQDHEPVRSACRKLQTAEGDGAIRVRHAAAHRRALAVLEQDAGDRGRPQVAVECDLHPRGRDPDRHHYRPTAEVTHRARGHPVDEERIARARALQGQRLLRQRSLERAAPSENQSHHESHGVRRGWVDLTGQDVVAPEARVAARDQRGATRGVDGLAVVIEERPRLVEVTRESSLHDGGDQPWKLPLPAPRPSVVVAPEATSTSRIAPPLLKAACAPSGAIETNEPEGSGLEASLTVPPPTPGPPGPVVKTPFGPAQYSRF